MSNLTTLDDLKLWAAPRLDTQRDELLEELCLAASGWIESVTGDRVFEQAEFTRYFSGGEAHGPTGDTLFFDPGHRPIAHSGTDLVVISESGSALSVTAGYDESADVVLIYANEDRQCQMVRPGGWSGGWPNNIVVTYKAGWAAIPANIQHLANEIAWLFFKSSSTTGKSSVSRSRTAVSLMTDLSPQSRAALQSLQVL